MVGLAALGALVFAISPSSRSQTAPDAAVAPPVAAPALARFAALKDNRRVELLDFMTPLADDREFMMRMRIPSAFA